MPQTARLGNSGQEVLAGLVERVTFHSPDSGFCVLRTKARGHRDLVTVVGHAAMVAAGEWITASGEWVNDRTHGLQVMTENPYRLARDIRGIGFKTDDAIAMKLGVDKTAMIRVRAGIAYALSEAMDDVHCGLPEEELVPMAAGLLEVPEDLVRTARDLELADGAVVADAVADTPCLFLAGLYRAERVIAERLLRIADGRPPWPATEADKALPWVEQRTGLSLAGSQADAVRLALASKVMVVTGGPGGWARQP